MRRSLVLCAMWLGCDQEMVTKQPTHDPVVRDAGVPMNEVDAGIPLSPDAGVGPSDAGMAVMSIDAGSIAPPVDAGVAMDLCPASQTWCTGAFTRHACLPTSNGLRWSDETCANGSGCIGGACVANACSDECAPGDARCELYDVSTRNWLST